MDEKDLLVQTLGELIDGINNVIALCDKVVKIALPTEPLPIPPDLSDVSPEYRLDIARTWVYKVSVK
jgi:hypothetical protein